MLDLVQLRSFVEVAERGTVAAAAAALGYTPPAVTQQVAKLERSLETRLFARVGGRLVLTDRGRALIPIALEMLALAAQAADAVRRPGREQVVIAGIASALRSLVAPRLGRMAAHAEVTVVETEDVDALRRVGVGKADVAVIQEYPGDERHRDPRLVYREAVVDELRLVLPPGKDPNSTLQELDGTRWLVNGTGTRCEAATRHVLDLAELTVQVVGDVSDNDTLLELVAAGCGSTIVPELVLRGAGARVTVARQRLGVARTLLAATRPGASAPALAVVAELVDAEDRS